MLRGHPGLIKSQEYTVSVFKIWWLLIKLCHQTIIFYLISPWNAKIVSALFLALSHSLVCNLVQKKTKRERGREYYSTICNVVLKQQVLQTGIIFTFSLVLDDWSTTNWKYLSLMIWWLIYHARGGGKWSEGQGEGCSVHTYHNQVSSCTQPEGLIRGIWARWWGFHFSLYMTRTWNCSA